MSAIRRLRDWWVWLHRPLTLWEEVESLKHGVLVLFMISILHSLSLALK